MPPILVSFEEAPTPPSKHFLGEMCDMAERAINLALPTEDTQTARCALFLTRGHNAARSAGILIQQGYEQDAIATARVIIECVIEFSFITAGGDEGGDDETHDRLNLFFNHAHWATWRKRRAICRLHGLPENDPELVATRQKWDEVRHLYPTARYWHPGPRFRNLRDRAVEVDRVRNSKPEPRSAEHFFENLYDLGYAEGCEAAHPAPSGFAKHLTEASPEPKAYRIRIGPTPVEDSRTLDLVATHLGLLVSVAADHLRLAQVTREVDRLIAKHAANEC